uniref:Peptidase S1 domain-containing protein n=1 Tax=Daphnia galeata TaxID=27404 RepID=A0A8J2WLA4_9CRUS|nr:unnamed protein product [Daphnia galeata]
MSPRKRPSLIMNNGSYQRIPQEKIVGGTIVVPHSLPFQVSIQRRTDAEASWAHYCGGVILDSNVVITAAHCVSGQQLIFYALALIKYKIELMHCAGEAWSGDRLSDLLRSVNVSVVADEICDEAYGGDSENPIIFPSMMCAGDTTKGGLDSCQGDSGGPLFTGSGENAVLYGIVSWGEGCALASYPGTYSTVLHNVHRII